MSDPFDRPSWRRDEQEEIAAEPERAPEREPEPEHHDVGPAPVAEPDDADALEQASENVLESWPEPAEDVHSVEDVLPPPPEDEPEPVGELPHEEPAALGSLVHEPHHEPAGPVVGEHAPGDLLVPPGVPVLEGAPRGERRAVGIVVARFNGEVTSRLLASALAELRDCGVTDEAVTVMPVPGAFELPLAAMALAKTRRFACIIALGCVIRGDTPHFDYVASEAASGLQLAAIETGVPVAFGVLTLDRVDQADARADKGAEAVRTALEMADLFAHLRAAAAR
jgi:6,7-dimethyl-8-ribityllumazine synthase